MKTRFLFFLLFILTTAAETTDPTLNDDILGLIVFKADLEDPQSKLASWNEDDVDPCGWVGVKCDSRSHRVAELSLDGLGLSGKIGRGLLQLSSLRKLSLSRNNFSGALNPDLTRLENLHTVDLSDNALSGPIPSKFFWQCRSLRSVSLAVNRLSGEIPATVGNCLTLASLNLSSNLISGSLPSEILSLYGLRVLDLSVNFLVGKIPNGLGRMFNLRTVSLKRNWLSGILPDDIGGCLLLRSLDLGENLLSGVLPETMRRLTMCSYLSLRSNNFSGDVPLWLEDMKNLRTLDLSKNGFSGGVPDSIGSLQFLKRLNFSENSLTGSLPESMGSCRGLVVLDFSRNSLVGSLPSWLFQLGLQKILLSGNNLNGSVRISSASEQTLQILDLSANTFSGLIPPEIGGLLSLQTLNLSHNLFIGSIPLIFGKLKVLEAVDLSVNQLRGNIPQEIGAAVSLRDLNLEKNSLSGGIPIQIGNCSSLTSLILSHNNLSGPIPATLAKLTSLQIIDLSRNNLSGNLPKELSALPHLLSLNISHNFFSGEVPSGLFNKISPSSLSDNPDLCGSAVNRSCSTVLPKPIVLNPNSSSSHSSPDSEFSPENLRHKKIILSISAFIAIGAAVLIALGVITITLLNFHVRAATSHSAATLNISDDYMSQSPATDANSGKLVMFGRDDPDFSTGAHAILNKDCELGRGGFGTVYKTVLRDGKPVVIKKLTVSSLVKSRDDFEREIKKFGKMKHPNLVCLEGYYWTKSLQLLIYEFVSGGSLFKHLHESPELNCLSWQERFDIILGVARSLAHLHRHGIIHYNLKSNNVLIDGSGEPKIADYGLAKLLPMLDRYILSSKIQSALGYMAPEFACQAVKITDKCDVYGFGVLVLEIVTGKKPVEYMEDDVVVLCDVVRGALDEGRVEECLDGRLAGKFPVEEAVPVVKLGLICTSQVPSNRPDMNEVVKILELIRCPQDSQADDLC
ncbi:probable LRR receptor-like serine/threonine-protein kinase IRK [Dendrobium catenatum]|uniref:non-specific serine/threonine protein kinase n=1 Tax=Dendrobium catenatum TaxID=906689 RepID=A0A2I0VRL3_9ASPA|nr:probable LRR receptor-like serine/threonine-protein kinase IRK [Dendrobium catenatum]PKU66045.1 inactive leucine-rich repeat receptor-like protein kinase [Dendrobium catenatum]